MPRTAIYARKSTESDDRQVQSLDAQLHWALTRCADVGLGDPIIFKEAQSAKTPGRPEFNRLMELVDAGEVDTIVTWKADRLARNARDAGTVQWALESGRLKQIITSDRPYTRDADVELFLGLELSLSAKYSKDLSKNVQRGIAEKLRRGEWSWKAPLGYRNLRENADHSVIVVDEPMAAYVRRMYALAADGSYSIGRLADLARDDWKLRLPVGRSKTETKPLTRSGVHSILTNPFYYGAMIVKGEAYQGSHEPLVSKEQFDLVQDALAGRRLLADRPKRLRFKLSALMSCGHCGRRMSGFVKTKPSGKQYVYYVCSKHLQGACPQPLVAEAKLYPELYRILSRISLAPVEYEIASDLAGKVQLKQLEELERLTTGEAAESSDTETRISRLLDLLLAGQISESEFARKRRELQSARVEQSLSAATAQLAHKEKFELLGKFLEALVDAAERFNTGSEEQRRELFHILGFELVAKGEKVLVRCGKPAKLLMERGERPRWWALVDRLGTVLRAIQSKEQYPIQFSIHIGPPPSSTWKRRKPGATSTGRTARRKRVA
ncbi:MAG TPA: recombinase family protein [Thermoanaerobaculia bacterium]|nr:recombinase family protein [Thermoanaerobaculia bacterium]